MPDKYGYVLSLKKAHLMPDTATKPGEPQRAVCGAVVAATTDQLPVYPLCEMCQIKSPSEPKQTG